LAIGRDDASRADRVVAATALESAELLDILAHPNPVKYPGQRVLVVAHDGYAYLVPFVEQEDGFFLKTIVPSRKATRDYLMQGSADE
jgi:hypothetical protein